VELHVTIACINDLGLFDVRDISERIKVENGTTMEGTKTRSLRFNVEKVNGKTFQVLLQEVRVCARVLDELV
jgi:hypothetical protein